jgi:hypothetical protein
MTIPNSRGEPPPPPLPPPIYMDDIAAGSDPGWAWENRRSAAVGPESRGRLGSDSSMPQGWKIKQERDEGPERPDYSRRGSSQATIKPAPELPTKYDFSRHHDEGYYSLSGPSPANYQSVSVFFSPPLIPCSRWSPWKDGFGRGDAALASGWCHRIWFALPWGSADIACGARVGS